MNRATDIADAITKNWVGTPPAWAVDAQNELRRLDAEMGKLLEGAGEPLGFMWQHDETARVGFVDEPQRAHWEKNNPRLHIVASIYSESQVAAAVAKERERIINANAPEIDRCNQHIATLESTLKFARDAMRNFAKKRLTCGQQHTDEGLTLLVAIERCEGVIND